MSDTWHQKAIAITGAVGSGKSAVASFFRELGGYVIDADELAREVLRPGSEGAAQVIAEFGRAICHPSGEIDRRRLAKVVFGDLAKRRRLEEIVHPLVAQLAAERFEAAVLSSPPAIFYDCPLLFEAGLDRARFKAIVLVTAPESVLLSRLTAARGWTVEEARKRLASQLPLAEKASRSDLIIDNSGDLDALRSQVQACWTKLVG